MTAAEHAREWLRVAGSRIDSMSGSSRAQAAVKGRRLCARHGLEVPGWARPQRALRKPLPAPIAPAAAPAKRCAIVTPFGELRRSDAPVAPAPTGAALTATIPPELQAWRQRTRGACIQINAQGVTLHAIDERQHFASVAEAVAAVAS